MVASASKELKLRSSQELFDAAKEAMLNGRMPQSDLDWIEIVRYLAVNLDERIAETGTCLILAIFGCELRSDLVRYVVNRQLKLGGI